MKLFKYLNMIICCCLFILPGMAWALPVAVTENAGEKPLVIIVADKLEGTELFNSNLPAVKHLLSVGSCGLMNIRSSTGYTDSGSGYLTLGAGSRATATGLPGAFTSGQAMNGNKTGSYINWGLGVPLNIRADKSLAVPEIGWILNQAQSEDHPVTPGKLGTFFQRRGWRTCLLGNIDTPELKNRPGGLLLMNRQGLIDEGAVDDSLNDSDPDFPYLYRANVAKTVNELQARLTAKKLIVIDFGDFSRLDAYKETISPARYLDLKQHTWERFNLLLGKILQLGAPQQFSLVVISPSVSKESVSLKNLLTPLIIYSRDYPSGLLVSGTTRWPGLVANIDLLPTLANLAHLKSSASFTGKTITSVPQKNSFIKIRKLNENLVTNNANLRPILNWYQGIISFCWIAGWLASIYLKRRKISDWLINTVAVIPLALIILPLLPTFLRQVAGFLSLTLILTAILSCIKNINNRILILSGLTWMVLIIDQLLGWNLIRFSALGYNAMAGSRYYGLGNEFLGVLLAAALLFTHLLIRRTNLKWPALIILGLTIFILSWPQFGAKFGGILAGTVGFAFYLMKLYNLKLNNGKLWLTLFGCCLVLFAIGWWDSMRPPNVQTHIGRFVHLLIGKDFDQVGQIIIRKILMNLKLTVFSPWSRIILLALAIGVINRLLTRKNMIKPEDDQVWQAIIVAGITAYLVNDAGVLAFATCLAFSFSCVLLKNGTTVIRSH